MIVGWVGPTAQDLGARETLNRLGHAGCDRIIEISGPAQDR